MKKEAPAWPIRPSQANAELRQLALELEQYRRGVALYKPRSIDPALQDVFLMGYMIEDGMYKKFDEAFDRKVYDKQAHVVVGHLEDGTPVAGSTDARIVVGTDHQGFPVDTDGSSMLVDIKSKKDYMSRSNSSFFEHLKAQYAEDDKYFEPIDDSCFFIKNTYAFYNTLEPGDFLGGYLMQQSLYALSSYMKERNVTVCSLLFVCKNDMQMYELRFKPCKRLVKLAFDRWNLINSIIPKTYEEGDTTHYFMRIANEAPVGSLPWRFSPYQEWVWPNEKPKWQEQAWPQSLVWLEGRGNFEASDVEKARAEQIRKAYKQWRADQAEKERISKREVKFHVLLSPYEDGVEFEDGTVLKASTIKTKPYNVVRGHKRRAA